MLLNKSVGRKGIVRDWAGAFTRASHSMMCWTLVGFGAVMFLAQPAHANLEASQVAILINKDESISSEVARMYQKLRAVPDGNLLRLSLGNSRQMAAEQYWKQAAEPMKQFLENHPEIHCILTTAGDPYTVRLGTGDDSVVAFDSELAAVLRRDSGARQTGLPNPLYVETTNLYGLTDPRVLKMVYVVRLDGPDLKIITRMVEDAIDAEKTGLRGPVFGDAQGFDAVAGSGLGDLIIRQAIDRFAAAGFQATLDLRPETWMQPKDRIGDQAAGAAVYIGWYRLRNFQNIFGVHGLARGSIAWHIASGEAADLWSPNEAGWCVNLLRHGAAVTLGPVREPYLQAFPHGDVFVEGLLTGGSIAESYWLALPNVSWAMVILGDPLYRPFAVHPHPSLVARAYLAENSGHVLRKGEAKPLLVQLECVGPSGSSVPTLTAVAEPETGLAAASGTVTIPALKAGQMAVVRVPSVTAGGENGGMFRLRLNVLNTEERSRHITLEGRIGLSRLSWGLLPKSQMFVSPNGKVLISGVPGLDGLTSIDTLQTRMITPSNGTTVAAVAFSPDSAHVALGLLNPEQKIQAVAITDSELNKPQVLPPARRFLRWLGDDRILVEEQGHYLSHSITGDTEHSFDVPAGWSATALLRTGLEILHKPDGTLAISKGNGQTREILQGTKLKNFIAVADDGSVFGGLDDQKRLWVQRGVGATPKIVAEGVRGVLWGPVSHRALVQAENGDSRVYDSLVESWRDLGVISAAQWNSDESRLLFMQAGGPGKLGTLSLFADRQVVPLFNLDRIGPVHAMAFAGQDLAFLLAEPTGEISVWMMNLVPLANKGN